MSQIENPQVESSQFENPQAGSIAPRHSGFSHSVAPDIARRQLRLSLALVGVLGLAIMAIAASSGFSAKVATAASASLIVQQPQMMQARDAQARAESSRL